MRLSRGNKIMNYIGLGWGLNPFDGFEVWGKAGALESVQTNFEMSVFGEPKVEIKESSRNVKKKI